MKVPGSVRSESWVFTLGNNMGTEKFNAQPVKLHACACAAVQSYMTSQHIL